jgi:GntR family trehalose operon transcriptional repressor
VRKAVDLLQERGYVQKIHGKGVFVLRKKNIEFRLGGIVSFREENERLNRNIVTKVVEMQRLFADKAVAKLLNVKRKTEIDLIKRVRNIDGENVILDVNYFVSDIIPDLTEETVQASIYEYIEQTLSLQISYAHRVIEAQPCTEEARQTLSWPVQNWQVPRRLSANSVIPQPKFQVSSRLKSAKQGTSPCLRDGA